MAMARSADTYRRAALLGLRNDLVRGGVAALLLLVLVALRVSVIPALIIAGAGYAGLRLISQKFDPLADQPNPAQIPRNGHGVLVMCQEMRTEIVRQRQVFGSGDLAAQLDHLISRIDHLMIAIGDDKRFDLGPVLLDLMTTLNDLLRPLAKVLGRGAATVELVQSVQQNLDTLAAAFDRLWAKVNADALADLAAAGEMIEFGHTPDPRSLDDGGNR
jgi:hypothetical protein